MTETVEVFYSLQHPKTEQYWNGAVYDPKFLNSPHRWIKLKQVEQRYSDYLVGHARQNLQTRGHRLSAWQDAPSSLVLITERVVSTVMETRALPGISGNNDRLFRFRNLMGSSHSYEYDDFRSLLRSKNENDYQFLIRADQNYVSSLWRHGDLIDESLAQIVRRNLGSSRSRVIQNSIFVKDQKDLLVLRMKGEIIISKVYDLTTIAVVYESAISWS